MVLVDGIYIHESGGKALLAFFIESLSGYTDDYFFLFDSRLPNAVFDQIPTEKYLQLVASEKARKTFYQQNSTKYKRIFCFANVPPPVLQNSSTVFIFMQNVLLLSNPWRHTEGGFFTRIILAVKSAYIRYKTHPAYKWIVQTTVVKEKLVRKIGADSDAVLVLPFFPAMHPAADKRQGPSTFIYVADGLKHKNHDTLLNAWQLLFDRYQHKPILHLTIPARFTKLNDRIVEMNSEGLQIINHGIIDREQLFKLYGASHYLVFPSLGESFGLPLVEAASVGCGILAADLPYVYAVVKPSFVFNPLRMEDIVDQVLKVVEKEIIPAQLMVRNNIQQVLKLIVD